MPPGSPGFWAGMYTWWYQKLPLVPQRSVSQVGSCRASWAASGTNVRSWTTSGMVSAAPGIVPLSSKSFFSVSSLIR